MDLRQLCMILLSVAAVSGQECTSGYPTAYMCQTSIAQSDVVVLDVSRANETGSSNCVCFLQANMSGIIVQFDAYPSSSDCGTAIELNFQDKGASFKCGVPHVALTSGGTTATIKYSLDVNATNPDSTYCMTFNGSTTEMNLILTCNAPDLPTTTTVPTNTTTTTTIAATAATTNSTNTTKSSLSSSSTTTPSSVSQTTLQPPSTIISNPTTVPGNSTNITVTPTSALTTSSSSSNISTASKASTSAPTSITASPNTTVVTTTDNNPNNSTTTTVNTTATTVNTTATTVNTTVNGTTTTIATSANKTTPVPANTSTTAESNNTVSGTTTSPVNVTTTVGNVSVLTTASVNNVTTVADNTTAGNLTVQTTASPNNVTSAAENMTTVNVTINTTATNNVTTTVNTTATPDNVTDASDNMTTVNVTINTTPTSNITTDNTTATTTVTPDNVTNTDTGNDTIGTTVSTSDATTMFDNITTDNITTPFPQNFTSTTDDTTSFNVTDYTTIFPDNVTTVADNTTADNVTDTTDNTTTSKPKSTEFPGFWEPPDYEAEESKSNNLVIILPLVGIFLIAFMVGVTVIICKRTKRAARLQRERSKEEKTKGRADKQKTKENPFLVSNYNPLSEKGRENAKNDEKELLKHEEDIVRNKPKDNKYTGKESNSVVKDKSNAKDDKIVRDNNNINTSHYKKNESQKAPKVYEPTGFERDVLENLELTSIVIEPDPEDGNRYFKKENPGDWYRIIMKGKTSKDSDELGNTKNSKSRKKGHRKSRSSKSGSDSKSEDSSGGKHGNNRHNRPRSRTKHKKDLDETMKSRSSIDSWDELDETMPKRLNDNRGSADNISAVSKPQPRLVVSQPLSESRSSAVPSTPPASRVIMSQPKSVTTPTNIQGSQKLVQMRPASGVARQPQTSQAARTVSPGAMQQSGIRSVPIKRPDIVPPLNL